MKPTSQVATQDDTIEALFKRSKRRFVPIRKTFVQQGQGKVRVPGPLASFVAHSDPRALELYLLIHAAASSAPFDVAHPAAVWARALGLPLTKSSCSAVSKALRRIEQLRLITRVRAGSKAKLTLLDEGGNGDAYLHPSGKHQPYFKLSFSYWTSGLHHRLSMPAKAILMISLSLDDDFILPIEKGPDWYGISADTVQRGLDEISREDLLDIRYVRKKAPLAPLGYTQDRHYTLKPPFGPLRKPLAQVIDISA